MKLQPAGCGGAAGWRETTGNKERGCGAGSGVRVERQKQSRAGAGRREEGGLRNVRM